MHFLLADIVVCSYDVIM